MDDEDYFVLARSIRAHLEELGLHDIADFRNYMVDDDGERLPLDGRTLMKLMLEALDRYLAANASETVDEALGTIRESIDGEEAPSIALVHLEDERMAFLEGREIAEPIATLGKMSEAREALRELREVLLEDPESPEPERGLR